MSEEAHMTLSALAPEVKRLIEAAYQQGFMRGMNQVAEHLLAADTRLPIPSPSWDALLSREETP